ncbi:alpha/beta hydrolase, partial [Salmonella enterica subsp. enterica serovar Infantis]
TVIGYRGGTWIYEWAKQAMDWQQTACQEQDAMQSDYYTLYERYFAPRGIAMLTLDMPSVGFSSKWKLTQDSSVLHQHVLKALPNVPWVD